MSDSSVRDDIAFIRRTVEDGRAYATARSPDMVVWGIAVAIGYLTTYATARGWLGLREGWIWGLCIGLPWLYALRRVPYYLGSTAADRPAVRPMTRALQMLWLGCGITITMFAIITAWSGDMRHGWADIFSNGILGIGFFTSASLCNLAWMRWVALGWWLGVVATFALRNQIEILPVSAALMLLLLALPGIVLLRARAANAGR